ncbi:LRFN4 [Branchiostoma lanceolatum]|uniref:LRFN4 protein n=1 Tax=Branchiostoma lanceolatum TaxID=7740 RepID=A0A8K0EMM3_BRALA|nr:LRFN4 [Branchiostoma lanceolatum]
MILWTCWLQNTVFCSEVRRCDRTTAYLDCRELGIANRDIENLKIFQNISQTKKDKISIVYLSRNQLTEVPWSGLLTIPRLSVLYLDHNRIESFSPGTALRNLSKISFINLSCNRIKTLTEDEFRRPVRNRPLLRVYLDENPIHCDERVVWLANISLHEWTCRCFKECYGNDRCMQQCQENCTVNSLNVHFNSDPSSRLTCTSPAYMRGKRIHDMLTSEKTPMTDDVTETATRFNVTTDGTATAPQPLTEALAPNGGVRSILPNQNQNGGSHLILNISISVAMGIVAIVLFVFTCRCAKDKLAQRRQVPRARGPEATGRHLTCSRTHAYETARRVDSELVEEEPNGDETTPYGIAKQNPIYVTADEQEGEEQ